MIASQATISGAFSMTRRPPCWPLPARAHPAYVGKRIRSGVCAGGQLAELFAGVVVLVLAFKSSTNLAAAYGIAVSSPRPSAVRKIP